MAPRILVHLGGEKIPEKVQVANKALIDWMAVMRKKKILLISLGTNRRRRINVYVLYLVRQQRRMAGGMTSPIFHLKVV